MDHSVTHALPPIDETSSRALIHAVYPSMNPLVLQRVIREAEGNPLALLEISASLNEAQRSGLQSLPSVLPVTGRLQQAFEERLASLPKRTGEVLLLTALEASGSDLCAANELPIPEDWVEHLAPAERAGLVRLDGVSRQVLFRHSLVASTIVAQAPMLDRRKAHRILADRFVDSPERRAWHLAEATDVPDEEVAGLLEEVARRAVRLSDSAGALTVMTRSAEVSPDPNVRALRLAEAAYIGAYVTGDLRKASSSLSRARLADPHVDGSISAAAAAAYILMNEDGDADTALQLILAAIENHSGRDYFGDQTFRYAVHTAVNLCMTAGRADLWEPVEELLEGLELPPTNAHRLLAAFTGDIARNAVSEMANLETAASLLSDETDVMERFLVGTVTVYADRTDLSRRHMRRVAEDARGVGSDLFGSAAMLPLAYDAFVSGDWGTTHEIVEENLRSTWFSGQRWAGAGFLYYQALLAAARGDQVILLAATDLLTAWGTPGELNLVLWHSNHSLALAAVSQRDYDAAYQYATRVSPPGEFAPYASFAPRVCLDLVESAVHSGRLAEARSHVDAMNRENLAAMSPRLSLLVKACEALVSPQCAQDLYVEALALPHAAKAPFDHARVQLLYGEFLRRSRAPAEARGILSDAAKTFTRLGALPWISRAENELRATGIRRSRRSNSAAGELTPQEREIALLAASGLSNKEIGERLLMSHRTVSTHLYNIFPKLGIASRAALRDALSDSQGNG